MKFLCVDFDCTLDDPRVAALVKQIVDYKKAEALHDIKIGIVTSRSIYDDFVTAGQFYHDIEAVLSENGIELDFICTRFCLHTIEPADYLVHDIARSIERANKYPIFGDRPSDYLSYRQAHRPIIEALRAETIGSIKYQTLLQDLAKSVEESIRFELDLRATYITGQMTGSHTPKINQIETVVSYYGDSIMSSDVLLLDDTYKHVNAVNEHLNSRWIGYHYTGDVKATASAMHAFLGAAFTLEDEPTSVLHEEGHFSPSLFGHVFPTRRTVDEPHAAEMGSRPASMK